MEKEILEFVEKNNLNAFSNYKTQLKKSGKEIFKTKEAKSIQNKTINKLSEDFTFSETSNIWNFFEQTNEKEEIEKRQNFFKKTEKRTEKEILENLERPKPTWKPNYGIIIVTENEHTLSELKKLNCPVQYIVSDSDIRSLEQYDLIQAIDCEDFKIILERLPQVVFLSSIEEAYIERHIIELSGWIKNLEFIKETKNQEIKDICSVLMEISDLLKQETIAILKKEDIEKKLEEINENIYKKINSLTISGKQVFQILSEGKLPEEIKKIVQEELNKSNILKELVEISLPLKLNNQLLEEKIRHEELNKFSNFSYKLKNKSKEILKISGYLKELNKLILLEDFQTGVSQYIKKTNSIPAISSNIKINNSKNIFLQDAKPINFNLTELQMCSILTGANSGGKTTLLEHILQLITIQQLGLPSSGEFSSPLFSEIYYFAKNKGSQEKGAFETLLNQMSSIKAEGKTLILADEIESVTEPGVAGQIISATTNFFTKKGCFLVIATHLGKEIQKSLPELTRIDGIEAKGLDENYNLIVDHNPVLGRLANSTPELIIEKLANSKKSEYFQHLHSAIKKEK